MAAFLAPGITRRSLFGFAIAAALAVIGLFLLFDYNHTNAAKGDQIRLGSALGSELQSAALTALRLPTLEGVQAEQERARLQNNIMRLRNLHADLRGQNRPAGFSAGALALLLDPPGRIDETLRTYVADLDVIANATSTGTPASREALRSVLATAEPLGDSLAGFVRYVETERDRNIRNLFYLLGGVLVAIVLLVLAGGLVIVRPVLNASARARSRLRASQRASERAREQILNALDKVSYGIALFDAADRLVVGNGAFHAVYQTRGYTISPGTRYDSFLREIVERELVVQATAQGDIWTQAELDRHNREESVVVWRFADGEEMGIMETKTKDGGTVVVQHEVAALQRIPGAVAPDDAHAMVEGAAHGLIKVDPLGDIQAVNGRVCELFGTAAEEVIGRNVAFLFAGRNFTDFLNGGASLGTMYAARGRHADGAEFPLEVSVTQGPQEGSKKAAYILTVREVGEAARVSPPLLKAQNMEAIGALAGGVAHDFNNVLSIIMGYSALLREDLPDEGDLHSNLDMVEQAARRARGLVEQILAVSRGAEPVLRPILAQSVVVEGLKLMRSTLPATIEIRTDIDAGGAKLLADPSLLQQVLMNLCTNGAHAIGEAGGVLDVRLKVVSHTASPGVRPDDLRSGDYLKLSVRDDGAGMDAATAARVFEPFFTTKDRGQGSGLGLAVVQGMVRDRGGVVAVSSAPGEGSTFDVYLPVYDGDELEQADPPRREAPKGRGRILFADDETTIVRLGAKILGRLGYTVEGVTSGEEALRAFRRDPKIFDLVITDQTMPGMTGENLIAEIRKSRADIPVILCTGYSANLGEDEARALGIESLLMKPLEASELGWAVARTLNQVPAT